MNKICDRLYLGNLKAAQDARALREAGITHILQVGEGIAPSHPKQFVYKEIHIGDTANAQIIRHFPSAISFMQEGVRKGGVLVHCYAGVSRSATCVLAYLMQTKNMGFNEAFFFASSKRPVIFPNMGFQK